MTFCEVSCAASNSFFYFLADRSALGISSKRERKTRAPGLHSCPKTAHARLPKKRYSLRSCYFNPPPQPLPRGRGYCGDFHFAAHRPSLATAAAFARSGLCADLFFSAPTRRGDTLTVSPDTPFRFPPPLTPSPLRGRGTVLYPNFQQARLGGGGTSNSMSAARISFFHGQRREGL